MKPFYELRNPNYFSITYSGDLTYLSHFHQQIELVYIDQGEAEVTVNFQTKKLVQGDAVIVFPNIIHSYKSSSSMHAIVILFDYTEITHAFFSKNEAICPFFSLENRKPLFESLLHTLMNEYNKTKNTMILQGLLTAIIGVVIENITVKKATFQLEQNIVSGIIAFIIERFSERITLDMLAKNFCVSKSYISQLFASKIRCSFPLYLNNIRIEHAKKLLYESNYSITQIASDCGYDNHRTFNRAFRSIAGCTPSEYKKQSILPPQ